MFEASINIFICFSPFAHPSKSILKVKTSPPKCSQVKVTGSEIKGEDIDGTLGCNRKEDEGGEDAVEAVVDTPPRPKKKLSVTEYNRRKSMR